MTGGGEISRKNGHLGGRPKGVADKQLSRLARARATKLAKQGLAPLDVMLGNMVFWMQQSKRFETLLEGLVVTEDDPDARRRAYTLLGNFLDARQNAQACAVDAAPYCHAKLANITVEDADSNARDVVITGGLPELPVQPALKVVGGISG